MKRWLVMLLVPAAVFFSGCEDDEDVDYQGNGRNLGTDVFNNTGDQIVLRYLHEITDIGDIIDDPDADEVEEKAVVVGAGGDVSIELYYTDANIGRIEVRWTDETRTFEIPAGNRDLFVDEEDFD